MVQLVQRLGSLLNVIAVFTLEGDSDGETALASLFSIIHSVFLILCLKVDVGFSASNLFKPVSPNYLPVLEYVYPTSGYIRIYDLEISRPSGTLNAPPSYNP